MRKAYIVFAVICSAILIFSCQKPDFPNQGNSIIQGHALLLDTTTSYVASPLKKQTIYISTGSYDTMATFFSTITDTTGYFSIPYLSPNTKYTVFARYFNGKKMFYGQTTYSSGTNQQLVNVNFYMYSLLQGNGIIQGHAYYVDSTISPVAKVLKNRNIYIKTGVNTYSTTTDTTGYYIISYLPTGSYTISATYSNGSKIFSNQVTSSIEPPILNVTAPNLNLYPQNPNSEIQGHAYYVDSAVSTVPKILKKQVIYLKNKATSNIYSTTTDTVSGYYSFSNLPVGNYKIFGTYNNGSILFSADTLYPNITVNNQNIVLSNLLFVPYKAGSEFQGHAYYLDTTMSQLKKLKDQVVYIKDSTSSLIYIYTTITDTNGYYTISNLPIGNYYTIYSSYVLGSKSFFGSLTESIKTNNSNTVLPNLYLNP